MPAGGSSYSSRQVQAPVEAFFQRNHGFSSFYSLHLLDLIVQHLLEMVGILAVDLGEHTVVTRGIMNVRDFGYRLQFCHHLIIKGAFLEKYPNKGSNIVPKLS